MIGFPSASNCGASAGAAAVAAGASPGTGTGAPSAGAAAVAAGDKACASSTPPVKPCISVDELTVSSIRFAMGRLRFKKITLFN